MKNNKIVTIEELTNMVIGLASDVKAGFATINKRLDKVDSRLDKVDSRLDKVDSRLDMIESKLVDMDKRIDDLAIATSEGFIEVNAKIESYKQEQDDIRLRMDNVAHHFEFVELKNKYEILSRRIEKLEKRKK